MGWMRWVERLQDNVPEGYACEVGDHGMVAIAGDALDALDACGYGLDGDGAPTPSSLGGRRPLWELHGGDETFLVRRFSHGGLLRFVTGRRFANPLRPFREILLAHALRDWGFTTPDFVAARALRAPGAGWHLEVVSRRIEDALDLGAALAMDRDRPLTTSARSRLLRQVGETVRGLHDRGFLHADLTPRNLLVRRAALRGEESPLWILDLDGSRVCDPSEPLDDGHRADNLCRLIRHTKRLVQGGRAALGATDWLRFLRAYEPLRSERRALVRRLDAGRRRGWGAHAVGWALERGFAGRSGPS